MIAVRVKAVKTKHRYVVVYDGISSRIERYDPAKNYEHTLLADRLVLTFAEAKRCLVVYAKDHRDDWLHTLRRFKKITKEEVDLESEGA